jgi:hypothetical protein
MQRKVLGIMEKPEQFNILASAILVAREIAKHHLRQAAEKRASDSNQKRKVSELQVGNRCYLDVSAIKGHEFANQYEGPFWVIRILSPQNVTIQDISKPYTTPTIVRTSRLKPQPPITADCVEQGLPKYAEASTQTHKNHQLEISRNVVTQTNEDPARERSKPGRNGNRAQKEVQQTAPPAEHRYELRSKTKQQ